MRLPKAWTYTNPKLILPATVIFSGLLILNDQIQNHGTRAKYISANTPHTVDKVVH